MDRHSSYSAPRSERASGSYGGNRGRSTKRNTYNKRSWNDNRKLHTLVFYILPFILINLVIFIVATSKPKIEYDVSDTRDYRSVDISIRIRSLLPIRETSVTMESQPLEMEKEKGVYTARHHSSPGRYGAYHTGRLCDGKRHSNHYSGGQPVRY